MHVADAGVLPAGSAVHRLHPDCVAGPTPTAAACDAMIALDARPRWCSGHGPVTGLTGSVLSVSGAHVEQEAVYCRLSLNEAVDTIDLRVRELVDPNGSGQRLPALPCD